MDVNFTMEQQMLRDSLAEFVRREVPREKDREYDQSPDYPYDLFQKLADIGMTGLFIPTEYGGMGRGPVDIALAMETLTYGSITSTSVLMPTSLGTQLLIHGGSDEQRSTLLPMVVRGEARSSFGLSEPHSGSDAASLRTRAVRDGSDWVINGSKMWSSGADVATHLFVAARTNTEVAKQRGISVFIVDPKTPGITISRVATLGPKAQGTCQVFYDDVRVPADALLGGEAGLDQGWRFLHSSLSLERLELAALTLGLSQRALDDSIMFVNDREAFGQKVGKFQAIQHMAADMATRLEAGRALTYKAAALMEAGQPHDKEVTMAKVFVTETANKICLNGIQMMGGYGYSMEFDLQRYLRRTLVQTIGGGTTQVLRNVIARHLGM
jgi:alkylation response protein AidB-like acyl-CoA dehydrogenase